jgi:hypothetical protein
LLDFLKNKPLHQFSFLYLLCHPGRSIFSQQHKPAADIIRDFSFTKEKQWTIFGAAKNFGAGRKGRYVLEENAGFQSG